MPHQTEACVPGECRRNESQPPRSRDPPGIEPQSAATALRSALMTRLATFGRVDELAAIEAFLESSALQIAGAAGIGKTTLLRHAMTTASRRGFTVLGGVASQADSSVSLAVLADVLGEIVDAVHGELAPPQARALDIALLRADAGDGAADRRAIATAALETIRAASRAGPVLIAIDDLQWVDES